MSATLLPPSCLRASCRLACRRLARVAALQRALSVRLPLDAAAAAAAAQALARHARSLQHLTIVAATPAAAVDTEAVEAAVRAGHVSQLPLAAEGGGTLPLPTPHLSRLQRLQVSSPAAKYVRLACRSTDPLRL